MGPDDGRMNLEVIKHKVKGFTIVELLVTLALTSMLVTLAYNTLSYIQKLMIEYKQQNLFLNECLTLNRRLHNAALNSDWIMESGEQKWSIKNDTVISTIEIRDNKILFTRLLTCDTFHIRAMNVKQQFEPMNNQLYTNKLVKELKFETMLTKQVFNFYIYKHYDAAVKLKIENQAN